MPYSEYLKRRAFVLHSKGLSARAIVDNLADEGLHPTQQGIAKFIRRVEGTGSFERQPGSGRPSKVTPQVEAIVEAQMRKDDETTAEQLRALLRSKGHDLSYSTIQSGRDFFSIQIQVERLHSSVSPFARHANIFKNMCISFLHQF